MSFAWKLCLAVLLAILVSGSVDSASTAATREVQTEKQTETPTEPTEKPVKICDPSLSCGWAVYTPFTREIKYFMKNSCECPENQNCIRVDDDPVISAFIYKCKVPRSRPTSPTTTQ